MHKINIDDETQKAIEKMEKNNFIFFSHASYYSVLCKKNANLQIKNLLNDLECGEKLSKNVTKAQSCILVEENLII
jgi:hypothetical protein